MARNVYRALGLMEDVINADDGWVAFCDVVGVPASPEPAEIEMGVYAPRWLLLRRRG
jgi:hypothetical protein